MSRLDVLRSPLPRSPKYDEPLEVFRKQVNQGIIMCLPNALENAVKCYEAVGRDAIQLLF